MLVLRGNVKVNAKLHDKLPGFCFHASKKRFSTSNDTPLETYNKRKDNCCHHGSDTTGFISYLTAFSFCPGER